MKVITRNHNFENKLNFVQKKNKYFYLGHEKSANPIRILINSNGLKAFESEDWNYFENKEAIFYGGSL